MIAIGGVFSCLFLASAYHGVALATNLADPIVPAPGMSGLPSIPGVPRIPIPSIASPASLPKIPNIPISGIPSLPGIPSFLKMPPGISGPPNIPSFPGTSMPGIGNSFINASNNNSAFTNSSVPVPDYFPSEPIDYDFPPPSSVPRVPDFYPGEPNDNASSCCPSGCATGCGCATGSGCATGCCATVPNQNALSNGAQFSGSPSRVRIAPTRPIVVRNGLPPTCTDSFVDNAGAYAELIYGDEGSTGLPPYFEFTPIHRINAGIVGIRDAGLTTGHGSEMPTATGGDEFVKTERFTGSGSNFGAFQTYAAEVGLGAPPPARSVDSRFSAAGPAFGFDLPGIGSLPSLPGPGLPSMPSLPSMSPTSVSIPTGIVPR